MIKAYLKTSLVITLQLVGLILTKISGEPFPLILSSVICSLYLFFEYKLFRDKFEISIAFLISLIVSIVAIWLNIFPELTTVPFMMVLIIAFARKLFIRIMHKEPETAARGCALIKQRNRTYSWIILNILIVLVFLSILRPWGHNREKGFWIAILFVVMQLPFILIIFAIKNVNRRRKRV